MLKKILTASVILFICTFSLFSQLKSTFTVVLDPGHGAHDSGTRGVLAKEKEVNLSIALKVGKLLAAYPDMTVLYTRKTDRFIPLVDRANFANKNKADIFVSIHANALPKVKGKNNAAVNGIETYVNGLAQTEENFEVAKRENEVILLEDNYKAHYEGFDPRSPESYIIFEMMQNKHMKQSIELATIIQKSITRQCNRNDRGVRQSSILVLRQVSMPSVLIEVGYMSNAQEERYIVSENGQDEIAKAIHHALVNYKNESMKKPGSPPSIPITDATAPTTNNKPTRETAKASTADRSNQSSGKKAKGKVYKIQILASVTPLKSNSSEFKGLKNISHFKENGWYKYTYGKTSNYNEILRIKKNEVDKKFKNAFIISSNE